MHIKDYVDKHAQPHKHRQKQTKDMNTMSETKTITCTFTRSKETKGAYQYKEDAEDYKIGSLYLRKTALGGDTPETITATVTYQV